MNLEEIQIAAISRDLTDRTAKYLFVLGIVQLVGLNLGGLIDLWLANGIRRRSNGFRIAAIWINGLEAFAALAGFVVTALDLSKLQVRIYSFHTDAPKWFLMGVLLVTFVLFALPVFWLNSRGTRLAFLKANNPYLYRHLCPSCGYDLRATPDRCPECGQVVTHSNPA